MKPSCFMLALLALSACGPEKRREPAGVDAPGGGADAPDITCEPAGLENTPETCSDGRDQDCNTRVDCGDPTCSGVGSCPVCGEVANPEATPLALPDGVSTGAQCTTDANCAGTGSPNCIIAGTLAEPIHECHASYSSILDFVGFPQDQLLSDTTKLIKVCVNMEHSWMRDLHMELISPPDINGDRRKMALHKFIDRSGDEAYLGMANDSDSSSSPVPGTGQEYCWDQLATVEMINGDTGTLPGPFGTIKHVPPGTYKPVDPFANMLGAPLNGMWEMRVTDLWGIDNGFMFEWSIQFDSSLIVDCSGPIIARGTSY